MILPVLYRIGHYIARVLPRKIVYCLSDIIADIYCFLSKNDKRCIISNLKAIVSQDPSEKECERLAGRVFRNFARYLADFFQLSKLDGEFIKRCVKVEGEENVRKAHAAGKGVIILSAHIGNWELGGVVMSLIGYPLNVVALTHQNQEVNNFFLRQRAFGKVEVIPIGPGLKKCFSVLRHNGFLALLGDRDFSDRGIRMDFFGHPAKIPTGPAALSVRTGAMIVPTFMIRQEDDTFTLTFEESLTPRAAGTKEERERDLMVRYLAVIEGYVRKYPTQWFMFQEVWNDKANSGPYTVI